MRVDLKYASGEEPKKWDVVRTSDGTVYLVIHYGANGLLIENKQGGNGGNNPENFYLISRHRNEGDARVACSMGGFDHGDLIA